jgi:hypothetical protein
VLNEVELICWRRKYVLLVVLNNLTLSTKYVAALKVELRKFSRDDQSEAEKLKQIVRTTKKLVARRLTLVRVHPNIPVEGFAVRE